MYYLACDIGASGGRMMLGGLNEKGRIELREIYRFDNGSITRKGRECWDTGALFGHVLAGLKAAAPYAPYSFGADTWGVDFVLLDKQDRVIGDAVAYRDRRTEGMDAKLEKALPFARHYEITGIAKQPFNTVYQLMSLPREELEEARSFLMMPDYIHFLLSGVKRNEYTNASTTAMLDAAQRDWSPEILAAAGIPQRLFDLKPAMPGSGLGPFSREIEAEIGYPCKAVLPATHDTASAFMAIPAKDDRSVYLSSGTWSLLGVELAAPIQDSASLAAGFTNEGGYMGRYRYLKNIMGLWIFQRVREELDKRCSYAGMAEMAKANRGFGSSFDANDRRFFAPQSMIAEIRAALKEEGKALPESDGELFACIYHSLAKCYREAVRQLEELTGRRFTGMHIVGGGSRSDALNQWTADYLGIPVYAGPSEGTALGNIAAQMIASGELKDLAAARMLIAESFDIKTYLPNAKGEVHHV